MVQRPTANIHCGVIEGRIHTERRRSSASRHLIDLEGNVSGPHEPIVLRANVHSLLEGHDWRRVLARRLWPGLCRPRSLTRGTDSTDTPDVDGKSAIIVEGGRVARESIFVDNGPPGVARVDG